MTFNIGRRQFLMGSSALVAAGAIGGPAFAQDKRMRLAWWGGQARADRTDAVSKLYAEAHPGVTFDTWWNAFNDYWPKLGTEVAGGNAADVYQMDYRYLVEYAQRGAIAPLDDYVASGALDLSDFDQDQLDGGKVDGKLYGISLGANSVALMINKTVFETAGVEVPGPNTTYDDLKAMAEAFASKGIAHKVVADGSVSEPMFENWLRQRGKALYTADGKVAFDEADATEWYKLLSLIHI